MIYLALYKGQKQGRDVKTCLYRLLDWGIRISSRGQYSHCELVVRVSGEVFDCYSASMRDGGVRRKTMTLPSDKWDLIPIVRDDVAEAELKRLFAQTQGAKYDYIGAMGAVLGSPERQNRWFCSEWCGKALGLAESWRFTPNDLAVIFKGHF